VSRKPGRKAGKTGRNALKVIQKGRQAGYTGKQAGKRGR